MAAPYMVAVLLLRGTDFCMSNTVRNADPIASLMPYVLFRSTHLPITS